MFKLNLKKNIAVGVSINPEAGLEVAQVDFATQTVLKYASKPLVYDNIRKEIVDMDIFKETLQEMFYELSIPKGSEVVLSIPPTVFNVTDYPSSLSSQEIDNALFEELASNPLFENNEPVLTKTALTNSTMQQTKYAYAASSKVMITEIAMQIKELGYSLIGVDLSVNSTLNALVYNSRVEVGPNTNWVMLIVENSCCRVLSMQGKNYIDSFEERISIGEVLGDEENYSTVAQAVNPVLGNLPSQFLYVVSKTNVISAQKLTNSLIYNTQIIYQESNFHSTTPFIETAVDIESTVANQISIDVIGAAIWREFKSQSTASLNLFNESLGDIYLMEQPPIIKLGSKNLVLSLENMLAASIVYAIVIAVILFAVLLPLNKIITQKQQEIDNTKREIAVIQRFLKENDIVSANDFDETDEIKLGLINNKGIYSYYSIVGTEIPKKLWLTNLSLGKFTTIEGQADNLESIYSFFRNIRDYNPDSKLKLQKLSLASVSNLKALSEEEAFDTDSIITSMNADFYEFRISNAPAIVKKDIKNDAERNGNVVPKSDLME